MAARFAPPVRHYDLAALAPGAQGFSSNNALAAALAEIVRMAPAGRRVRRLSARRSQHGTAIEALRFSRGPGRPLVQLLGQQHGDEPATAEALLLTTRALATGDLAPLRDHIDVTVLPRANPDGAELQRRRAADGLDINRDHLLLRTAEACAVAGMLRGQRRWWSTPTNTRCSAATWRSSMRCSATTCCCSKR